MTLPFELFVALRYLLAPRKQAFISLISLLSILGVAVGVAALVIALALMTGLQGELRDRIVGASAHVYVWKIESEELMDFRSESGRILSIPQVMGVAPAILGKALISSDRGESFITLKGIDPVLEPTVTDVGVSMREGSLEGLADRKERETEGIVIGEDLAVQLGAFVGDTVTLLTPQGTLTPMGLMPRSRRLEVVGVFNLGLYEYDSAYGLVSVEVAKRLLDKLKFDFVQVRVEDMYSAPRIADSIEMELGPGYITQDWAEMNRSLFSALWLEKIAISITIGLIVTVAAMNIIASLVLLVMEKSRDIAILKTIGASRRSVTTIFMLQGLTIGLVGTTLGATGGYVLSRILDHYQLIRIPMDVYQVSYIPFKVEMFDFGCVVFSALLICFLATIYPSRQASRLDPAQALRNQ